MRILLGLMLRLSQDFIKTAQHTNTTADPLNLPKLCLGILNGLLVPNDNHKTRAQMALEEHTCSMACEKGVPFAQS